VERGEVGEKEKKEKTKNSEGWVKLCGEFATNHSRRINKSPFLHQDIASNKDGDLT